MDNEELDLTSFSRAVETFRVALDEYTKDEINDFVRDACIQRFKYCYDSSKKIIKRYLKGVVDDPMELESIGLANLIRDAYTRGLVKHSWDVWDTYRLNRNATSHGYDEATAIGIVEALPAFYQEVLFLLERLGSKNET